MTRESVSNYLEECSIISDRMCNTQPSFIREILKVTEKSEMISFAGGLPNPISFPVDELKESMNRIVEQYGDKVFQYSTTEGHSPLREWVAKRYQEKYHISVDVDDIIITTGSQQGLDLMGKVLINKGDRICLEKPGYLGAIQAFSLYEPEFMSIPLLEDGIDLEVLEETLKNNQVKLLYVVPNFQNPTGLTYSKEKREALGSLLDRFETVLIEDDPYSDLSFDQEQLPYIGAGKLMNSVLFGSISKIITPGLRLGWICTKNKEILKQVTVAKQASDLHSNIFSQYLIYDYLMHNDLQEHINGIRKLYKEQRDAMLAATGKYFPKEVKVTNPKGGMFMWAELPEGLSSAKLFQMALEENVAFVPGNPFYTNEGDVRTLRLNYTNSDATMIEEGIKRLGKVITTYKGSIE
ncbi:MAG TPA: aspartate aminotransferase [Lachnospiraceae bacterium]|uniref:aminotransferase-like domain-containing protein n=1 Tax=Anaerosporobacter sp. TaxID=1872529 RepID=UPI000EC925AA|nr:PLP-dependent aminotransferase family protein [Anaerosporobacter sp.]HAB60967.1 aspartate aminotransferase [Lachnospiraceae bacterium]